MMNNRYWFNQADKKNYKKSLRWIKRLEKMGCTSKISSGSPAFYNVVISDTDTGAILVDISTNNPDIVVSMLRVVCKLFLRYDRT